MPEPTPPTIDPGAAQRWQQLPIFESPWLHEEVAQRMQQRLDWIKLQPSSWLHWTPLLGGLQAHAALLQRYPKAHCTVLESSPARAQQVSKALLLPRWQPHSWRQPKTKVTTHITQPVQMLWANMALHLTAQPQALIKQWQQALQVDGFLMFSALGPDSLHELRSLYRQLGWGVPAHEFTDMHDWGDMLVAAGLAQPVLDVERITLTFETPQRLLQELRGLGRNLHRARFATLRARRFRQQLLEALASQPLQLTFEVIYGHAFKSAARLPVGAQSEIGLDAMRAALARHKSGAGA